MRTQLPFLCFKACLLISCVRHASSLYTQDDDEEGDDEPMEGQAKAKSSSKAKAQRAAQVHHPA